MAFLTAFEESRKIREQIEQRKALRRKVLGDRRPNQNRGGAFSELMHINNMKEDGIAGYIIAAYLWTFFEALMAVHYAVQKDDYKKAQQVNLNMARQNNPIRLAYDPNDKDMKIYFYDSDTEQFDFTQTYEPGKAPRSAIRAMGYVLPPDLAESYLQTLDEFQGFMYGHGSLSAEQQLRDFYEKLDGHKEGSGKDYVADNAIMNRMRATPAPRPH